MIMRQQGTLYFFFPFIVDSNVHAMITQPNQWLVYCLHTKVASISLTILVT